MTHTTHISSMTSREPKFEHSKSLRRIDGSKTCAELMENHLQYFWCGNDMSLWFDHEQGIGNFIHGDVTIRFIFSGEDRNFILSTFIFEGEDDEEKNDLIQKLRILDPELVDQNFYLSGRKDSKAVFLFKRIHAVCLLLDEEIEQSLQGFISMTRKLRSLERTKHKKLSWFRSLVSKRKKC
jgi:hypothetical protein